ncbi:MAG TPA: ABC transporter substrate-binding protein [Pseudolabrys sp.]|jgi:NitT/TauT family transport system substrate-binding protein
MILRTPIVCIAALISAVLAVPAFAQELKPWKHGIIEPKADAGFSVMVSRNGFAEKRGLKVEIVTLKNGATAHKALLAGELDSIESSPGAAILAGAHGADIKIVGCDWPGVPHGLMVRSTVNKVEDLKGKTIAVAAPGSLPNLLINAILEKSGVPSSDVRFANLGSDLERYKAILAGVADAGIVAAEFTAIAPKDLKMLVAGRDALPNYVRLCLTTTGKVIASRRADAVAFVAAEMDALHYTMSHRDETIALTGAVTHAKPDDPRPAYVYDDTVKGGAVDPDIGVPMDKLNWLQSVLLKAGNLKTPIDLSTITAPDIRDEAAKLSAASR